jgi:hypothetical protein
MERQWIGTHYKTKGYLENITSIFLQKKGSYYRVAMRSSSSTYYIGEALTEDEATWLAQEIETWLDYSK